MLVKETLKEYKLKSVLKDTEKWKQAKIFASKHAYQFALQFYTEIDIYESFFLLLLDRSNKTIGYAKISQGGVAGTVVDPKIIFKYALESLASGIIMVHNHPSGNLKASISDIELTKKVKNGAKHFDINLLDHLIISENGFLSMADECLI